MQLAVQQNSDALQIPTKVAFEIGKGEISKERWKVFSKVRIGLNESQDRNCSSKQIQLPEALLQKETNELYAQGYLCFYKRLL